MILLAWVAVLINAQPVGLASPTTSAPDVASTSQPDGQGQPVGPTSAPEELESLPPPAIGQSVTYLCTSAGPQSRLRQTIEAVGPDITVSEQVLVNNQPVGKPTTLRLPRFARWPAPMHSDARTIRYSREKIDLAGQGLPLDCVVLTIESRSAGVTRVMKQWVCPTVPVTHVARLVVTTDGREVYRQELVEFGVVNK